MKKIKLVVSDLHLSQGRALPGGMTNPLEEFHFDEKFREFLHYHTTGEFAEYEVELILNGDILNLIQMPYRGHHLTVITEDITVEKVKTIVSGHPKFFAALKKFAENPKNKITYVVGNHDQGMLWAKAREYLESVVGAKILFKNIVYYFDGVHIEHGHMYEAANRIDPKKFFIKKNLPEPILNLPFGSHFFIDFVLRLKFENPHVDKVRPFGLFVRWGVFFHTTFILKAFVKLLSYFYKLNSRKDPRHTWSFKQLMKIFLEGAIFPDLSYAAKKILKDDRVHTVIFGHSHVYMYRQYGNDKEYFNTGTWTEVTSLDTSSFGKITKLTFVAIEYFENIENDGSSVLKPRARLKEWRGYHRIEEDVVVS